MPPSKSRRAQRRRTVGEMLADVESLEKELRTLGVYVGSMEDVAIAPSKLAKQGRQITGNTKSAKKAAKKEHGELLLAWELHLQQRLRDSLQEPGDRTDVSCATCDGDAKAAAPAIAHAQDGRKSPEEWPDAAAEEDSVEALLMCTTPTEW